MILRSQREPACVSIRYQRGSWELRKWVESELEQTTMNTLWSLAGLFSWCFVDDGRPAFVKMSDINPVTHRDVLLV